MRVFMVKAAGDRRAEITLYEEIDHSGFFGISHKAFKRALDSLGDVDDITLRINSYGGDVFDGVAMFTALKEHKAKVNVVVEGVAASAASIVAMAGDHIRVAEGAFLMIHNPWTIALGDEQEFENVISRLRLIGEEMAGIYARRSGMDEADVKKAMNAETWYSGAAAVEAGLADEAAGEPVDAANDNDAAARFDRGAHAFLKPFNLENDNRAVAAARFRNTPNALLRHVPEQSAAAEQGTQHTPPAPAPAPPAEAAASDPVASAVMQTAPLNTPSSNQPPENRASVSLEPTPSDEAGDPMSVLERLQQQLQAAVVGMEKIQKKRDDDNRDQYTESEQATLKSLKEQCASLRRQIKTEEDILEEQRLLSEPSGRETSAAAPADGARPPALSYSSPGGRLTNGGFNLGFGEMLKAVYEEGRYSQNDNRLIRAAADPHTGRSGEDGGHLIPDDFRNTLVDMSIAQDPLLERTFQIPTTARRIIQPTVEVQQWDTTEGLQAYWTPEAAAAQGSKAKFDKVETNVNKIVVLVYVTEEMLEDVLSLETIVQQIAATKISWALSMAIARGTGTEMPLGYLNSPALVTVAQESAGGAQAADSYVAENFWKMYERMPAMFLPDSFWLVHPGGQHQIWKSALHAPSGADPLGTPPGSVKDSPFGTLLGRPVIPHEVCSKLGDLGDLHFVSLKKAYAVPLRQGGARIATSMHVEFEKSLMAFRFTVRAGGGPLLKKAATSRDDANFKMSPFITLAERTGS